MAAFSRQCEDTRVKIGHLCSHPAASRYTIILAEVMENAPEQGIGHHCGDGIRLALLFGAHRGGLAPVTGTITRRTG